MTMADETARNIGRLIDTVRDLSQKIRRSSESQTTAEVARIFRKDGSSNMPTAGESSSHTWRQLRRSNTSNISAQLVAQHCCFAGWDVKLRVLPRT